MGSSIVRVAWALFLVGTSVLMLTTLALGLTGQEYPGLNVPNTAKDQFISGLIMIFVLVCFATPFFTSHRVAETCVVLKEGVLFAASLRYDEIEDVFYGKRRPIGIGVRWSPDILFVITWPANLVEIRLRNRRVFRIFGFVPLPPVHSVVVNVDDPDGFVAALRGRLAGMGGETAR